MSQTTFLYSKWTYKRREKNYFKTAFQEKCCCYQAWGIFSEETTVEHGLMFINTIKPSFLLFPRIQHYHLVDATRKQSSRMEPLKSKSINIFINFIKVDLLWTALKIPHKGVSRSKHRHKDAKQYLDFFFSFLDMKENTQH